MPEAVSITMELPHSSFWLEASSTMPDVLKERVIAAFEEIHARGVLHGDPELRHMLIGADGRVTIIDFGMSRAVAADDTVDLEHACREEFLLEMREVKYKLDYKDARKKEAAKVQAYLSRARRNERRRRMWKRRRNGEKTGYISPEEEEPEDEGVEPPVHHRDFEGWKKGADAVPRRIVVPGQTEEEVADQVRRFIEVVTTMSGRTPNDTATLCSAFDSAYERVTKRKPEEDSEPLATSPSPTKKVRLADDDGTTSRHHHHRSSNAAVGQPRQRRKRVTFGGQSHRHIDAQSGKVVRCGGGTTTTGVSSSRHCAPSRCLGSLTGSLSASSILSSQQPPDGSRQMVARSHGETATVPRGILKRRRADEEGEDRMDRYGRVLGGEADHRVYKRVRVLGTKVCPRRSRRRGGTALNPLGIVLPAWRMFSTFMISLMRWRRRE